MTEPEHTVESLEARLEEAEPPLGKTSHSNAWRIAARKRGKVAEDAIAALRETQEKLDKRTSYIRRHDGPCYYCGEDTNGFSGYPSEWPLHFPHEDEPGKPKPHHVRCVAQRLAERDEARAEKQQLLSLLYEHSVHDRSYVDGLICEVCQEVIQAPDEHTEDCPLHGYEPEGQP